MTETEKRERASQPEHRWPAVIATLIALVAYAFLPSVVPALERYAVVGVCVLMIVALVLYNPHRLTRESVWSRRAEITLAVLILAANQIPSPRRSSACSTSAATATSCSWHRFRCG